MSGQCVIRSNLLKTTAGGYIAELLVKQYPVYKGLGFAGRIAALAIQKTRYLVIQHTGSL